MGTLAGNRKNDRSLIDETLEVPWRASRLRRISLLLPARPGRPPETMVLRIHGLAKQCSLPMINDISHV
jgi:hypothetical protein